MRRGCRSRGPSTFPSSAVGITVSVVSHGHGAALLALLEQLARQRNPELQRLILTLNLPEPDIESELAAIAAAARFELRIVRNRVAAGFGANHNAAFALDTTAGTGPGSHFAVLNPDLRLARDPFPALLACLAAAPDAGCAYPRQLDSDGQAQDHERTLPTPLALLRRYTARKAGAPMAPMAPDWVNAAFLLFPAATFARLGGFDTHYHMYCEDVDLCLRLRLAGLRLLRCEQATVIHDAQRATRRSARHLLWHVASLWRLWHSSPYREFRRRRAQTPGF